MKFWLKNITFLRLLYRFSRHWGSIGGFPLILNESQDPKVLHAKNVSEKSYPFSQGFIKGQKTKIFRDLNAINLAQCGELNIAIYAIYMLAWKIQMYGPIGLHPLLGGRGQK